MRATWWETEAWTEGSVAWPLLTAGSAVVTDDWQQVIAGGLGWAILGQERLQVQAVQGEGDVGAYLGGKHQLVSEALQVDAQDLERRNTMWELGMHR